MSQTSEYLSIITNAQTYKANQLSILMSQGADDCCLNYQVKLLSIFIKMLSEQGSKGYLTDTQLNNITGFINNMLGALNLGGVTNADLTMLTSVSVGGLGSSTSNTILNLTIIISNNYYTIIGKTLILVDVRANPVTVYISDAYIAATPSLAIKDMYGNAATNNITIEMTGTAKIDGQTSFVMDIDYEGIDLESSGGNLWIV